jgi:hypothetical protein
MAPVDDSQPLELQVLDALATGADTLTELAAATGAVEPEVEAALRWATGEGLALAVQLPQAHHFQLTPRGQYVVGVRQQTAGVVGPQGHIDLGRVSYGLGRAWASAQHGQQEQVESANAGLLVGDPEREWAVTTLSAAYAAGRLDAAELDRRSQLALTAQTRGELASAVDDVAERRPPVMGAPPEMTRWVWMPGGKRILAMVVAGFFAFAILVRMLNTIAGG